MLTFQLVYLTSSMGMRMLIFLFYDTGIPFKFCVTLNNGILLRYCDLSAYNVNPRVLDRSSLLTHLINFNIPKFISHEGRALNSEYRCFTLGRTLIILL